MSARILDAIGTELPPMPFNAAQVLVALACRADDDGRAFVTVNELAANTNMWRTVVFEAIRFLELAGLVVVSDVHGANCYTVTPRAGVEPEDAP